MSKDIFKKEHTLSLEVFPPKKDDEFEAAYETLNAMASLKPDYISVTYGAGGSRSKKTVELCDYIQNTLQIPAIAHITCVGNDDASILTQMQALKSAGVDHILALRGDRPKDMSDEDYQNRRFAHASDMISFLVAQEKQNPGTLPMHIAAAAYPEKHYESFSMETDIKNLLKKQEAGAEYLITQLFFDNDYFYSFCERAESKGITIPISAGIMPITSPKQIGTTVTLSGSSIPKAFAELIAKYGDNAEEMRKAGIDYAIRQIHDLQQNGVSHIHLYSMNKPKTTAEIMSQVQW